MLIKATAFGTQIIVETFEQNGIVVKELVAYGGLAEWNKLLLQIYMDVNGSMFVEAGSGYTSTLGAGMFGVYAAGRFAGSYDAIIDVAKQMASASGTRSWLACSLDRRGHSRPKARPG